MCVEGLQGRAGFFGQGLVCKQQEFLCEKGACSHGADSPRESTVHCACLPQVNGVFRTLPVSAAAGAITVSSSGRYVVLQTDFSLQVSYDADHSVEVKVPTSYFNLTCGMCGNFNSRREDDYMMPNGQQAADSNALGESWQVPSDDSDPSCGVPPSPEPCPEDEEKLYESEQFCGMLTASPGFFESCHSVINPQSYFETCTYDLCAMGAVQEVLCAALEAYADACQAAGVTLLPWRNATFCREYPPLDCQREMGLSLCPAALASSLVFPLAEGIPFLVGFAGPNVPFPLQP